MAEYSSYINKQLSWIYSHSSKFMTFQAAVFSATLVKKNYVEMGGSLWSYYSQFLAFPVAVFSATEDLFY